MFFVSVEQGANCGLKMKVRDYMSTPVVSVRPDLTIADAARLMLDRKIGGLPVIDSTGLVVGMLTEHDLLRRDTKSQRPHWLQLMVEPKEVASESARLCEATVAEVMTRNPLTVTEETSIEDACRLIRERRIKRLPVVREGRLVGIITRADLICALAAAVREIGEARGRADNAERLTAEMQRQLLLHERRSRF